MSASSVKTNCGASISISACRSARSHRQVAFVRKLQVPQVSISATTCCGPTVRPPRAVGAARLRMDQCSHRSACTTASAMQPSGSTATLTTAQQSIGVVIVDHGSRKKDSNDMLFEFGSLYQQTTGHRIVEMAHMELAEPTIEQAIGKCAARGAATVVVAPYFLSRGRHIQEDIPALVRDAQQKYPQVKCIIAEPIGIDPLMAQLISNRVAAALQPQ